MFASMTGFGRFHEVTEKKEVLVEIRSVNHRYFEFSARVPRNYGYLEDKLKALLQSAISRGKVEINVSIYNNGKSDATVVVNKELASQYVTALRDISDELSLHDNLSLTSISRFSDIFSVKKEVEDEDEIWSIIEPVVSNALKNFITMREIEGKRMQADVLSRLDTISQNIAEIEDYSPSILDKYKTRLIDKLHEVLENKDIDENRVLTEVAILSDKIAVDEETVRLKSHIKQFISLTNETEPVGRKLDFLIQEINREINTLGSKIQDISVTGIVVNLKSELEKIREQIQNIE